MARVMTVRGEIPPDDLGTTLPHEHILVDNRWDKRTQEGARKNQKIIEQNPSLKKLIDAPVSMDLLNDLRRYQNLSKDNLNLSNMNDAAAEITKFKEYGGRSIVELTTASIGKNPKGLKKISEDTGINIICGTGWYREIMHPTLIKRKNARSLSEIMVQELTEGIQDTGIVAGIIGELGCEVTKVLEAGGRAQSETGVGLSIHTDRHTRKIPNYIEILRDAGANLKKVIVAHIDERYSDLDY
jgi:phosphotriesterase-related protein